jgi:hypothetical protein
MATPEQAFRPDIMLNPGIGQEAADSHLSLVPDMAVTDPSMPRAEGAPTSRLEFLEADLANITDPSMIKAVRTQIALIHEQQAHLGN